MYFEEYTQRDEWRRLFMEEKNSFRAADLILLLFIVWHVRQWAFTFPIKNSIRIF